MDLQEEKELWRQGYELVVGVDEAGRGCLAGPVVAAAVCLNLKIKSQTKKPQPKTKNFFLNLGIRDSKRLTPRKRRELYKLLVTHPQVGWAIGRVGSRVIDRINILEATKLAMDRAVGNLAKKLGKTPDFLMIDGNFKINVSLPQRSIIKADETVFSCLAASIICKIKRDEMMKRLHRKHLQYGFDRHKGYPTKLHKKNLKKHGLTIIHRMSFAPCKNLLR